MMFILDDPVMRVTLGLPPANARQDLVVGTRPGCVPLITVVGQVCYIDSTLTVERGVDAWRLMHADGRELLLADPVDDRVVRVFMMLFDGPPESRDVDAIEEWLAR